MIMAELGVWGHEGSLRAVALALFVEVRSPLLVDVEGAVGGLWSTSISSALREPSASGQGDWLLLSGLTLLTTSGLGMLQLRFVLISSRANIYNADLPSHCQSCIVGSVARRLRCTVLASCARGAEGVAAELELRRVSPTEAEAEPLGIELIRVFSVGNGVEDGVGGCGEEGAPVGLGQWQIETCGQKTSAASPRPGA